MMSTGQPVVSLADLAQALKGKAKITKLTMTTVLQEGGENLPTWKGNLQFAVESAQDAAYLECMTKDMAGPNGAIMDLILSTTPEAWRGMLVSLRTVPAALAWINSKFTGEAAGAVNMIYRENLERGLMKPGQTVPGYLSWKRDLSDRLREGGAGVDDRTARGYAVRCLPSIFN